MKILFTRFPLESAYGGAEVQTLSLMEGLAQRGHAVAFVGSCPVLLAECNKRGILAAELDIGKPPVTKWGTLSFAWRKNGMKRKLEAVLNEFGKIDAICMLSLSEKLLLTGIAADKGIKVFWIEHDRIGRWLSKNPWLPMLLTQSKKAATIPVSHLSGKLYEELGWDAKKVKPIPNGIDTSVMVRRAHHDTSGVTLSPSKGDTGLHLLCVARLSPEKGIDVLIDAMKDVPKEISLTIVGKGPQKATLETQIKRLQLSDCVNIKEPTEDISSVYTAHDALVLPSRDNDPFGLVAAEAMAHGLPVIVTDQCGIAGYLKSGQDALIVKANSPEALSNAINQLLDTSIFKVLSENGPKTAKEKFSVERMVDEYEKVFMM